MSSKKPPVPAEVRRFQRKISVRPTRAQDFDAITKIQKASFPGMPIWGQNQFLSLLENFPEGQFVIEHAGQVIASSSSLIIDFDEYDDAHTWMEVTSGGTIRNHDSKGDTLYGIEIMVDPKYRGLRLARRLYESRKDVCRQLNLRRIMIGGRIPGYKRRKSKLTAREYVDRVIERRIHDPVMSVQLSNGFTLKRLINNYLPNDTESDGWATLMEWPNVDYRPDSAPHSRPANPVRICSVQYQIRPVSDFSDFARQCEYFVDVASGYRSDFVLFPELLTAQLLSCMDPMPSAEGARALDRYTADYLELFTTLAVKYNVNIIGGSHLALQGTRLKNISYLFRRDGTFAQQEKLHVTPAERQWWGVSPGDGLNLIETDKGRVSIQICYDVEFPELGRMATDRGARIIFTPFCTDERAGYIRVRTCAQARCIENQVYVAISGITGNLPNVTNMDIHYAQSGIFSPSDFGFARDGIIAECTPNIETVVIQDVDLAALDRARKAGTVTNWKDRRTDLYRVEELPPKKRRNRR